MNPDVYAIIGTGIALAALNIGLFAWLRADGQERSRQIEELRKEIRRFETDLTARMQHLETELRERMAKVEGLLEGLRESISGRHAA